LTQLRWSRRLWTRLSACAGNGGYSRKGTTSSLMAVSGGQRSEMTDGSL
jgi:hypothetical protein